MTIESVMLSSQLILCRLLLIPSSSFPSIRVFSNELALHIRWSRYWNFIISFSQWVVMYGCESWTIKIAEHRRIDAFELWCWRRLLRVPWTAKRSNQSILKEISPEYSLEEPMLKLKLQYFGHLMWRIDLLIKTLMLGKIEGKRRRGCRGWAGWMTSLTPWTWVWTSSRSWWWTGKPGRLWSIGSQWVGHDQANELNWTDSGLISFRIDWLDLLPVPEILKSLLQHHNLKASVLQHSAFYMVQLSHSYMTTEKTIALTIWNFAGKVMSLLFHMLSRFVIAFLPRSIFFFHLFLLVGG